MIVLARQNELIKELHQLKVCEKPRPDRSATLRYICDA